MLTWFGDTILEEKMVILPISTVDKTKKEGYVFHRHVFMYVPNI